MEGIFTDFKRHDLGANFYERNSSTGEGTMQTRFLTRPVWGAGLTKPLKWDSAPKPLSQAHRASGRRHRGGKVEDIDELFRGAVTAGVDSTTKKSAGSESSAQVA